MTRGVLFDVDGTLVDTNYLHVVAWADAFRSRGHRVVMSDIHPLIGQGSDRLVESLLGEPDDAVAELHSDIYGARLPDVQPLPGAADLLKRTKAEGLRVVLATSAASDEAETLCKILGVADIVDTLTTSDDADSSKPAPDIVDAALTAAGLDAGDCVFVGDSVWDVQAAQRAGMDCVCVLTGGVPDAVLRQAGAVAVYPGAAAMLEDFTGSPLGKLAAR